MRPDRLYLADIESAAVAIATFLEGVEEQRFLGDELLQSAVLQKLTVIGEAAARVSDELKHREPDIEWRVIVGLRNVVVHAYFSVSWSVVWSTVQEDVPELLGRVRAALERLPE